MKVQSSYICLNDMRFYAYHGVLPQERRVGGWYTVTLRVGFNVEKAMSSDSIHDTLDYATLYELVKTEMAVPSALIEHVAGRIASAIEQAVPQAASIDMTLTKSNPPMGADCRGASVEIHLINDKTQH